MRQTPSFILILLISINSWSQYPPAVGISGTTAIHKDSSIIVGWANRVLEFNPGPQDISLIGSPLADFGDSTLALGNAEGTSTEVVSLGDGGSIVLGFPYPIMNGPGFDFLVFENSFSDDFLEFAHVEVSTDGINFVRIPSHSLVQTSTQTAGFASTETSEINNLAGKYRQAFGTPFDLDDIIDSTGINLDSIMFVKIIDVVGSIDPLYGSMDSYGNYINEPFPTLFSSSGFDLDAVGMINVNGVFVLEQEESELKFSIFPNPTNRILNIQLRSIDEAILSIYGLNGSLIYSKKINAKTQIDLLSLGIEKGIYFLSIQSDEKQIIQKFILQ